MTMDSSSRSNKTQLTAGTAGRRNHANTNANFARVNNNTVASGANPFSRIGSDGTANSNSARGGGAYSQTRAAKQTFIDGTDDDTLQL